MHSNEDHAGRWYVRRGEQVRGPFRREMIEQFAALGRIRPSDRLSTDGVRWQRLRAFGAELAGAGSTAAAGFAARDERRAERRSSRRRLDAGSTDRRVPEDEQVKVRRARSERVWRSLSRPAERIGGPLLALGVTLALVVVTALLASMPGERSGPDCDAVAGNGVNWDFCAKPAVDLSDRDLGALSARNARLTGAVLAGSSLIEADLAYADFTAADLSLARLDGARLVGANLRQASLIHARLNGADLRFADLTGANVSGADLRGANLANAIWVDGRVCARASIGSCRPR